MHTLLLKLSTLTRTINVDTAELLRVLGDIDQQQLYLQEACSSLFIYLTERLHYAEGAAYKRIAAARAARRFPSILGMVERGDLHLTGIGLLAPVLTEDNHADVLQRACHQSKREIEKLVVALRVKPAPEPEPVQKTFIRENPQPHSQTTTTPSEQTSPAPAPVTRQAPSTTVKPTSARTYLVRISIGEETHGQLETLQNLLAHQIPNRDAATIISRAIEMLLRDTLAKKAALVARPRESENTTAGRRSRSIPAAIRRAVWLRDQGQCSFRNHTGQRCSALEHIEFHHVEPWAKGGEHSVANITLRCRAHNRYQAVLDYGASFMAQHLT